MRYLGIILASFCVVVILSGCGVRDTSVEFEHPSGAKGKLDHQSDTRKCGENMDCAGSAKDEGE